MDFSEFDTKKIDEQAKQAKESYGNSPAYKEFEQKSKGRSKEEEKTLGMLLKDKVTEKNSSTVILLICK